MLSIVANYHCMQECERSYLIFRKTNEPNLRKWQKIIIWGSVLANFAQIWAQNAEKPHFEYESRIFSFFSFENTALSVTRYHGVLSLLQYQKKLIIQS